MRAKRSLRAWEAVLLLAALALAAYAWARSWAEHSRSAAVRLAPAAAAAEQPGRDHKGG